MEDRILANVDFRSTQADVDSSSISMTYLGATENKTPHIALNSKKGQQEIIEKCLKGKNVRIAKKLRSISVKILHWSGLGTGFGFYGGDCEPPPSTTLMPNNNFGFPNIPKMCYLAKYQNKCFDNKLTSWVGKEGIYTGKERN